MQRILFFVLICCAGCASQRPVARGSDKQLSRELRQHLTDAVRQYKLLMSNMPEDKFARTFENGTVKTANSDGWVSGFFPATLEYLYEYSGDNSLWEYAQRKLKFLAPEQFNTHTHDLGFMMYCSFGNANRITPDARYETILTNSARSLITRFNPVVGCIRSWDSDSAHFLVIIDNMMNLELLMHAFRETHDSAFYHVAVTHANTTIKNHFRADYSSWHVIDYDQKTGTVQKKRTAQGTADSSAWARGQAWGLYGFTMMYRETGDAAYLEQATHIADFLLANPNLPDDKIPYWDYNAPGIPNALRDASAAAIMSAGLFELGGYSDSEHRKQYFKTGEIILRNLSHPPYKTTGNDAGGFILRHSVGNLPGKSEIDVPLSYTDYYYVEAALRYLGIQKIHQQRPARIAVQGLQMTSMPAN